MRCIWFHCVDSARGAGADIAKNRLSALNQFFWLQSRIAISVFVQSILAIIAIQLQFFRCANYSGSRGIIYQGPINSAVPDGKSAQFSAQLTILCHIRAEVLLRGRILQNSAHGRVCWTLIRYM